MISKSTVIVHQLYLIFRDPNCLSTIDVFNHGADWIFNGVYSADDVEEAILSVVSEVIDHIHKYSPNNAHSLLCIGA